ncbi:MAG: amidohydrolase family protein [Planctomycetota bacterium]
MAHLLLLLTLLHPGPPTTQPAEPQHDATIVTLPATRPAEVPETGMAVYVGDTVIFGYDPTPALKVDANPVQAAKFPVIDVHGHWSKDVPQAQLLAAMEARNVAYVVNLSGGNGDDVIAMLEQYDDPRLIMFYTISWDGFDGEAWVERTVADFERAVQAGAGGLKVWKDLGLTVLDETGQRLAIDDPRLAPIWDKAGELGVPVLIHSGDPVAFFEPIDEHNERWMQLHRHPSWSFHGEQFPSFREVLDEQDRMFANHPNTKFIGPHMAGDAEDLATLAERMRKLPNLSVDISGRVAELGRQPYTARKFLIEFQDRVLFGTDRYPGRERQPRHRIYFRFLETDDEYFKYYDHPFPPTGDWRIYGVFLPDDVLKKIYFDNAATLLGLEIE